MLPPDGLSMCPAGPALTAPPADDEASRPVPGQQGGGLWPP